MQAYGWSLPAKYSTEVAEGGKSLVSVPVPVYCRPLNLNDPGMKVCHTVKWLNTPNFRFRSWVSYSEGEGIVFTLRLMPESHIEVECPVTWGLEVPTPNPSSKSTLKPALPQPSSAQDTKP